MHVIHKSELCPADEAAEVFAAEFHRSGRRIPQAAISQEFLLRIGRCFSDRFIRSADLVLPIGFLPRNHGKAGAQPFCLSPAKANEKPRKLNVFKAF